MLKNYLDPERWPQMVLCQKILSSSEPCPRWGYAREFFPPLGRVPDGAMPFLLWAPDGAMPFLLWAPDGAMQAILIFLGSAKQFVIKTPSIPRILP